MNKLGPGAYPWVPFRLDRTSGPLTSSVLEYADPLYLHQATLWPPEQWSGSLTSAIRPNLNFYIF